MAENSKKETKQVTEYKHMRDLTKEELKQLPIVNVVLEKTSSKRFGEQVTLTAKFHDKFKKQIRKPQYLDTNIYHLICLTRTDFKEDENMQVAHVPVRYLESKKEDGTVEYRRFEVMITRDVVLSDILTETDIKLMNILKINPEWMSDKGKTTEAEMALNNTDYLSFA